MLSARRTPAGRRSGRAAWGSGSPSPAAWSSCTAAPSRRAAGAKATGRRSSSCCRWQLPMYELWRPRATRGDMEQQAKSILIVEDDADVRGALTAVLEGEGYHVVEAAHGKEALQRLRADAAGFCMILLDLWMPVMNGWEFRAEQLKDPTLAEVPVIVVTADHAAPKNATNPAAVDYVTKPTETEHLL